jgi:hypothetical protein
MGLMLDALRGTGRSWTLLECDGAGEDFDASGPR